MNILLVYATNSGTTQTVAAMIKDQLIAGGQTVTMKDVDEVTPDMFGQYDLVILGSPSWDYEGKEGQPHDHYLPLFDASNGKSFEGKKFAVFGLGDQSYTIFCGAVDHLEDYVKSIKGTLALPSLRIDNYYSTTDASNTAIGDWVKKLTT